MVLNRATPEQAVANRSATLAGFPPAGPNLSWDEYPFASSIQGGLGASVVPVPRQEQFIQGGVINAAYQVEAIGVGCAYWVVVIP